MEFPGGGEFCKQLYSNMDLLYFRAPGKGNGFTTKTKKLRKQFLQPLREVLLVCCSCLISFPNALVKISIVLHLC